MKIIKIAGIAITLVISSVVLSACTTAKRPTDGAIDYADPQVVVEEVVSGLSEEDELPESIPTTVIETDSQADQELLDELNQFEDGSLESDFSEIESQL